MKEVREVCEVREVKEVPGIEFYESFVEAYLCYEKGRWDVMANVSQYRDGELVYKIPGMHIVSVYDGDGVSAGEIYEMINGKTVFEASEIIKNLGLATVTTRE